jgi:phosphatidylglycerol---prolipoprotein diacylglyceryl transferase
MLTFPHIDPVAIKIGPMAIRWYSLAYIAGILAGWWLISKELAKRPLENLTKKAWDDTIMWAVIGIILGGRLGFVLFYKPAYYLSHPGQIFQLWEGGMSFHGGMLGFILAFYLFARKHNVSFLGLMDLLASVVPIGLFCGRVANFINGELYGRVTDSPLGMVFPQGGELPRHPSQLYEAGMEGILLFALLFFLLKCTNARQKPGFLSGVFLTGYSLSRIIAEHFREPDDYLGFIIGQVTMGQLLSLPMLAVGLYLMIRANKISSPS